MATNQRVSVFDYLDYRAYLRDNYAERKANEYGFSHRAFSKRAGLRSTNYLKLVMDGERNLTPEMAHQFAAGCGLVKAAAEYFCELVAMNQADSAAERNRCHT
ncbi:MAG TPA: TIGR02147 family protein, partial [Polyangiaceae bacterium]